MLGLKLKAIQELIRSKNELEYSMHLMIGVPLSKAVPEDFITYSAG